MKFTMRWLLPALLALALVTLSALADGGVFIGSYQDVMNGRVSPQAYQPDEPRVHDPASCPAPQETESGTASEELGQDAPTQEASADPSSGEWICSRCGSINDNNFCPNCGQSRNWICPNCGFENVPNNKFCPDCGTPKPRGKGE